MVKILIFGVLVLVGGAAGLGAGYFLRPAPEMSAEDKTDGAEDGKDKAASADKASEDEAKKDADPDEAGTTEIVKLNNQFIVPVLDDNRVTSMVVLSMSLETEIGTQEFAFQREPKIRDALLQVLFDHANAGQFNNNFTSGDRLERLRDLLRAALKPIMGDAVLNVLITDIARQDM